MLLWVPWGGESTRPRPPRTITSNDRAYGAIRCSLGRELYREPDVDTTVLRAGVPPVPGVGEEAVMAAGSRIRMIVAILDSRIGPVIVVVIIGIAVIGIMVIITPHRGLIVMMVLRRLLVTIFRMVLRRDSQRHDRGQRESRDGEKDRLPNLMLHEILDCCCNAASIDSQADCTRLRGFNLVSESAYRVLPDIHEFRASPVIVDGKLYLRSQSTLYCIGKK